MMFGSFGGFEEHIKTYDENMCQKKKNLNESNKFLPNMSKFCRKNMFGSNPVVIPAASFQIKFLGFCFRPAKGLGGFCKRALRE